MTKKIDNYYNTFDPAKGYTEVLFRDGKTVQGREWNELQNIANEHTSRIANALFRDGDILAGGQIVVDPETGNTQAQAGEIFLAGRVWDVPAKDFIVAVGGIVFVGIRLHEQTISELEDPKLLNPALGSRGEGQAGAWRKKQWTEWGFEGDGLDGNFYPVYTLEDGVQRAKETPPNLESFNLAIARYDKDSTGTGTYATSGLTLTLGEDLEDGRQVYHLSEGRARVDGLGVELNTSRRVIYNAEPDLRFIDTEVHVATSESATGQRLTLAHPPMKNVTGLRITAEKTVSLVHGAYSGALDDLPDTSIVKLVEIKQGDTIYEEGTDYVKTGDRIDWSPLGNEPSAGSTYSAKYQFIKSIEPESADVDGFTVTGAVPETSILISYNQMLPRYDRLAITSAGELAWFKGIASENNPQKPNVPESVLAIATVYQSWRDSRSISNDGVRVVPFADIQALNFRLDYALAEIARQRLEADIATRESGARAGIFVDPLTDDTMRDQGIEQTAAIFDGILTLPVLDAEALALPEDVAYPTALNYNVRPIVEQTYRTTDMQVNPYMAFDPLPATVQLNPAVDHWTETQTAWASSVTKTFKRSTGTGGGSTWAVLHHVQRSSQTEVISSNSRELENLRQINVSFTLEGFGEGELLESVTFDGIDVTPQA